MTHVNDYGTDLILDKSTSHDRICLAELVRAVRYFYCRETDSYARDSQVFRVDIARIRLDRGGYTRGGGYRGAGLPLFELEVHIRDASGEEYVHFHEVRAFDRPSLRADLKRIYRNATVSR